MQTVKQDHSISLPIIMTMCWPVEIPCNYLKRQANYKKLKYCWQKSYSHLLLSLTIFCIFFCFLFLLMQNVLNLWGWNLSHHSFTWDWVSWKLDELCFSTRVGKHLSIQDKRSNVKWSIAGVNSELTEKGKRTEQPRNLVLRTWVSRRELQG